MSTPNIRTDEAMEKAIDALTENGRSRTEAVRYGVVIQSDAFARSTVTVALTSTSASRAVHRPEIEFLDSKSRVLTDQIYSVDHGRLGECKGVLEPEEQEALDRALLLKLALL